MRSIKPGITLYRSIAVVLAAIAAFNVQVAWGQVPPTLPEEVPLTAAQEASIREEMSALAAVLVNGGKSPQDAKLAAHAVGVCLGAAYGHGLTRQQAQTVCGKVLDAFTIEQGTILYQLTPEDHAWVQGKVVGWTQELALLLEPDELSAVRSTMQACLEGHMRRGENREGAVGKCAMGLLPLLNRPELRQRIVEAASRLP